MKLPFRKSKKKKKNKDVFLTVDLGSQSVKCLAIKVDTPEEGGKPELKLVGSGKEWLEPYSIRSGYIVEVDKVAKALDSAIFKATENLHDDVDDVIFGVSGDVCTCLVTTARSNRDNTKEVTQKELDDIDKKIVSSAFNTAQEHIAHKTGDHDMDIELITTSTVYTKLDGNFEDEQVGKTAGKIETALFTAFTPRFYLHSLEEIASLLNLNVMAVTSNLYSIVESLKISREDEHLDCVVIDIGSDTTDVAVGFGGGIVTSQSLILGGNHFTKQISMSSGLNFGEAEKRKYDYTFGHLSDEENVEMLNTLNPAVNLWLSGLELVFTEFNGVKTFAPQIFLTGGGSKLPALTEALENKPWTKSIPFKEPPTFNKITANDIKHVQDISGDSEKEEFIVPLALSVIYLEMHEH